MLRRLERKGFIALPPNGKKSNQKHKKSTPQGTPHETHPLKGKIKGFTPIELKMVRGSPQEVLYNGLIHQYHYLGHRRIVGPHLKYIAFIKERPAACLSWGGAAWNMVTRAGDTPRAPPIRIPLPPLNLPGNSYNHWISELIWMIKKSLNGRCM